MGLPLEVTELIGHALLFLLVFGMSATVDLDCVLKQLHNTRALSMGVLLQFVVLPFLGFLTVKMLGLDNAMGLTLLVVTSSPGGSYSNWWCSIFNADLALSVTMTAISTILAIIMLPLNLAIYTPLIFKGDNDVKVTEMLDFGTLVTSICVVFGAIGAGIMASIKIDNHNFHIFANRLGSVAGVSLVMLSGIVSSGVDGGTKIWERDAKFFFGVALPIVVALFLSNVMTTYAGLKKPERVTSSIECCYQNCGIATSVALSMFQGEDLAEAMCVPFLYGFMEFAVVGMYVIGAWKAGWTKAPPTEPFWKVVTVNYEVLLAEKMAKENNNVEVQLEPGWENVEVGNSKSIAGCLYYCHEPDLDDVVEIKKADEGTKKEKLVDSEEETSIGESVAQVWKSARTRFWEQLGYDLKPTEEEA